MDRVRGRGELIKGGDNGKTEGVIPLAKVFDSAIIATAQGGVRRGAASVNLSVNHKDFDELLSMRKPHGDVHRQCLNLHHCAVLDDAFMNRVEAGDKEARERWISIIRHRLETGEPYLMFIDNINKVNPEAYVKNNLKCVATNICSEITLHTDELHSFICCLSSLNLTKWDEWKDSDIVGISIKFLNGILNEFIDKAKDKPGFERVIRSAVKGRVVGLGVLGWPLTEEVLHLDTTR